MDKKDTTVSIKRLSNNAAFYNNVFKKCEKISSVVLYLISFSHTVLDKNNVLHTLEKKSFNLHEVSLKSLNEVQGQTDVLYDLRQCLIELQSTLELAVAARELSGDTITMLTEHIDAVHRHLTHHYLQDEVLTVESLHTEVIAAERQSETTSRSTPTAAGGGEKVRRARRVAIPAGDISSDAYLVHSQLTDRAGRIKTVLEAKPQATVKDIAEIVTDVSEKTIQRELNSLIEKGQVVREGERRWSKYSVLKDLK